MIRALVTGGSGDIGAATCHHLARAGLHVIVHANASPQRAEKVAHAITSSGGTADTTCFDVTDADATRTALDALLSDGAIQVLVNNAGIHEDAPMAGMTREQWQRVIDVSLHGFFNVTQPLLLPMMRTRWGRIISMSSVAATIGNRGQANYAAAKAGLLGATRSLALEVASRGITVNAIAPGIIATDMTNQLFGPDRIRNMVPMQRAGTPGEVAALVKFLASNEAAYISGQVIAVNGAMAW
jgi:3-oxoacyl-[acyl-carrier protein] reductase